MLSKRLASLLVVLAALTCLACAWPVLAQEAETEEKTKTTAQLWDDLLHYIKIAQPPAAQSSAKAILESEATPRELYGLSVETPGALLTLNRGENLDGMKEYVERIRLMIRQGYEAERSDPESIAYAIGLLGEERLKSVEEARRRLKISGEYALPQLVGRLTDPNASGRMKERIVNTIFPAIGKEGVRGLSVVLQSEDDKVIEQVAYALGQIGYPHAAPRLREVLERDGVLERTKNIVEAALINCAGRDALKKTAAELFYEWSEKYYYEVDSIRPDSRYDEALVWYWQNGLLTYTKVPSEIFCEIYAMRNSRLTLKHEPKFYPAVSLWLSAIIRKEAQLPQGKVDPTHGEDQPGAEYYALASSPKYLQQVLARALKDKNSAVATETIRALAKTAGAKSLSSSIEGGAQPLVAALSYPDRRVRFLAAWALGSALPEKDFQGRQLVLPVLNEAIRQTATKTALVVIEGDQLNAVKAAVRSAGFIAVDEATPGKALKMAREEIGVDVVVLANKPDPVSFIQSMRQSPTLTGIPVVVASNATACRRLAEKDGRVVMIPVNPTADDISGGIEEAMALGVGEPLSDDERIDWAVRACQTIRQLGITNNEIYDLSRSQPTLIGVLDGRSEDVQVAASGALAMLESAKAQRAIVSLATNPDASQAVRIEACRAGAESVRRLGNQLTEDLASAVVDMVVSDGEQALKVAAAQLQGALNLPSEKVKDLIVTTAPTDNE